MKITSHKRCIIVGAGVAGIAAALECIAQGIQPILIEAKPYIGGRARSFVEKSTNETIDNGQHLMMGCYTYFLQMLERLGTTHLLKPQPAMKVMFYNADGTKDVLDASRMKGKNGVALGIWNLKHVSTASKLRALLLAAKIQFNLAKYNGMSAAEFLQYHKQPQEIITRLWEPVILATLNSTPENASASLLVEVLKRAMFGTGDASSLLLPQAGLSELFEPLENIMQQHGGSIMLSTEIKEVLMFDGNAIGVVTEDDREVRGDDVILTIPPRALQRLNIQQIVDGKAQSTLQEYVFSPIISVYLWFDKNFMDDDFAAMLETTTQWVFNKRKMTQTTKECLQQYPGHVSLTVSAANPIVHESAEHIAHHCTEELRKVFPAAHDATLLQYKVIKEKQATFLATPQLEPHRLQVRTTVPNVYLAGDWTNTGLPATLEGAAQSGVKAVTEIISA